MVLNSKAKLLKACLSSSTEFTMTITALTSTLARCLMLMETLRWDIRAVGGILYMLDMLYMFWCAGLLLRPAPWRPDPARDLPCWPLRRLCGWCHLRRGSCLCWGTKTRLPRPCSCSLPRPRPLPCTSPLPRPCPLPSSPCVPPGSLPWITPAATHQPPDIYLFICELQLLWSDNRADTIDVKYTTKEKNKTFTLGKGPFISSLLQCKWTRPSLRTPPIHTAFNGQYDPKTLIAFYPQPLLGPR